MYLKRFAWSVLLQAITKSVGIVHFILQDDVQAAGKGNSPAVAGHDVACMDVPASFEFPGEVHI